MKNGEDRTDSRNNKRIILRHLFDGGLRKSTEDRIRAWIAEEDDADAKSEALEEMFGQRCKEPLKTDTHTLDTLNDLRHEIGLPKVHYRIVKGEVVIPRYKRPEVLSLRRQVWLRVAAVLIPAAVIFGVGALLMNRTDTALPIYTTVSSPADAPMNITLPDGSEVRMAPDTELMYAAEFADNRSVKLSGEAFFVVQRAEGNPFTVEAGGLTATVLGTEFNVHARAGHPHTEVSLASGSVEVRTDKHTVVLSPMEGFVLDNLTGEHILREVDHTDVGVWKGILLKLDNLPIVEALGKVAQFYGVTLDGHDNFRSDMHVRTVVHREDRLDDVMRMIQAIDPGLAYIIQHDILMVSNR